MPSPPPPPPPPALPLPPSPNTPGAASVPAGPPPAAEEPRPAAGIATSPPLPPPAARGGARRARALGWTWPCALRRVCAQACPRLCLSRRAAEIDEPRGRGREGERGGRRQEWKWGTGCGVEAGFSKFRHPRFAAILPGGLRWRLPFFTRVPLRRGSDDDVAAPAWQRRTLPLRPRPGAMPVVKPKPLGYAVAAGCRDRLPALFGTMTSSRPPGTNTTVFPSRGFL